jgi:hypothetical protein
MGQLNSSQKDDAGSHRAGNISAKNNSAGNDRLDVSAQSNAMFSPGGHHHPSSPVLNALKIDMRGADAASLMVVGELQRQLRQALPPTQQSHWKLLYASRLHGKNFTQLVKRLRKRGPSLIVIHDTKNEFGEAGRVFGGYTNTEWRLVSDREHDAKANAAARMRAQRSDAEAPGGTGERFDDKPKGQAKQFFGTDECFVFTSGVLREGGTWETAYDADNIRIHRSRVGNPSANANYMYLMDFHPQSDRVGIGMGSDTADGVGEFAWFLDRYLGKGRSSIRVCPTFGNTRLSSATEFTVAEVEVYAVDGDAFDETGDADEERDERALLERHATDKKLLELTGKRFYSDETREGEHCCS